MWKHIAGAPFSSEARGADLVIPAYDLIPANTGGNHGNIWMVIHRKGDVHV